MKQTLLALSVSLLLVSCNSDEEKGSPSPSPNLPENTIALNELEDGQVNYYLRYESNCQDLSNSFRYTGDTLIVEVQSTSDGLIFNEYFSPGSAEMSNTVPALHRVIPENGYILIPERQISYLFFFYGNDTIHLEKSPDLNLQQGTCFIEYQDGEPFIGEEIGYLDEMRHWNIRHENVKIISCVPFVFDLDAYLVYTQNQLYMSHVLVNDFDEVNISGYTLLR